MKGLIVAAGTVAILLAGAVSFTGPANAAGNGQVARAECQKEKKLDRAEFIRDYGRGKLAMVRCVRHELREARRECRLEKSLKPAAFRAEYGKGRKAMVRCVRDELI